MMEAFAVLAFSRAAVNLGDAAPGDDDKINPYAVSLNPDRWEADGLFDGSGLTLAEARESEAAGLQNLYLEGKKNEAEAAVPAELLERTSLVGPESYLKERLAAYKEAGVTVLTIIPVSPSPTEVVEKLRSWID